MSRYCLLPSPAQEAGLREHCAHVWNLAVEQESWWRPGRKSAPGYCAQAAQLTEARAEHAWLVPGPQTGEAVGSARGVAVTLALSDADVNAARNIAAGHAVTARGGPGLPEPVNREPQLLASLPRV